MATTDARKRRTIERFEVAVSAVADQALKLRGVDIVTTLEDLRDRVVTINSATWERLADLASALHVVDSLGRTDRPMVVRFPVGLRADCLRALDDMLKTARSERAEYLRAVDDMLNGPADPFDGLGMEP